MDCSRRDFLRRTAAFSAGFFGLGYLPGMPLPAARAEGGRARFGPLVRDPRGVFDLPRGFRYVAFSAAGERMDDGLIVPTAHDGMGAFEGPEGRTILVRNHELDLGGGGAFGPRHELLDRVDPALVYDRATGRPPCLGGTTTLVFDTERQRLERHFLSLAGTVRNCAGGPTPWNSWISCEETVWTAGGGRQRDHGYAFEVPATAEPGVLPPKPLPAMGRFRREGVALDPRTGWVYQTEDENDSALYRFLPDAPGELAQGGRLQALVVRDRPRLVTDNRQGRLIAVGERLPVEWIDLEDAQAREAPLRRRAWQAGAARFRRAEGIFYADEAVYFTCTSGGPKGLGQVWRLVPDRADSGAAGAAGGTLELFVEAHDPSLFDMVDNIVSAPWGDLILCEDGPGEQRLIGVTPDGEGYVLARNARDTTELAGATFSPDGSTLFVNLYHPGLTLAVTGPWPQRVR